MAIDLPEKQKQNIKRYAAMVEYNGSNYHGWQKLKSGLPSIQQTFEEALSKVANESVNAVCAGRTDAGVHARQQIIHFDCRANRSLRNWLLGINHYLPDTISLLKITPAPLSFHARFSAMARRYQYIIFNRDTPPAIQGRTVTWSHRPLDATRMHQAAQHLVGEHDFSAYRTVRCQAHSPIRTVHYLKVRCNDNLIIIDIQANGFLHHMVRNIAGALMSIGAGLKPSDWTRKILVSKDRKCGHVTAKPHGLYFMSAFYQPEKYHKEFTENEIFENFMEPLMFTNYPPFIL